MTKSQKKVGFALLIAFFISALMFIGWLITTSVLAQEYTEDNPLILEDGTELTGDVLDITPHPNSRYGQLENDPKGWREVGHVDNRRLYLNIDKIEKVTIYRHIWVMFEFTDGPKVIPGYAVGVIRVVSEANIECSSGLVQPLRDYYVDKDWVIRTQTIYETGQARSFAKAKGSIAWAMKAVACHGASIEDVQIGRGA